MVDPDEPRRVAQLEARVAALEAALRRRSSELRELQQHLCGRDLLVLDRLQAGLPPPPRDALELTLWRETTKLQPASIEETLQDLWRSLAPAAPGAAGDD